MQSLFEQASFSHSGTRARVCGEVESIRAYFLCLFFSCRLPPPHCEPFVLYWHGEHPSHQCLHASAVPGGALGGDEGVRGHSSPTIATSGIRLEVNDACARVLHGVQQVVGREWLKDARRLNQSCCWCLPNKSKTTMRRALLSQYIALFLLIYFIFLCKGWI